jgi:hypothetical protein
VIDTLADRVQVDAGPDGEYLAVTVASAHRNAVRDGAAADGAH